MTLTPRGVLLGGLLAGAVALPIVMQSEYLFQIGTLALIWAIVGSGWNILGGYAGQISFGHGAFFGIGAYAVVIMFARFDISPWAALVIAPLLAAAVGTLVGMPTLRLTGPYFALATMAFQVLLLPLALYFDDWTGGSTGLTVPFRDGIEFLEFRDKQPYYLLYLFFAAVLVLGMVAFGRTRFGRFLVAIRDDETAASALGVDAYRCKLAAMALSCAVTAFGGVLYTQFIYFVDPESVFGFAALLQMVLVCVLGGVGTPLGPIVGAAILIPMSEVASASLGYEFASVSQILYGALLMATVILLPRGVVGAARR